MVVVSLFSSSSSDVSILVWMWSSSWKLRLGYDDDKISESESTRKPLLVNFKDDAVRFKTISLVVC